MSECHATVPLLTELDVKRFSAQITGVVAPTKNTTMIRRIMPTPFDCTIAGEDRTTICQMAQFRDKFTVSLTSQVKINFWRTVATNVSSSRD